LWSFPLPAYLDHFKYDIFISYAWGGNVDADGDKAWASEFKRMLEMELNARLTSDGSRPVSIFLDTVNATNGDVEREFGDAIRNSALLLAIVTPAFCKSTCFCRKEVEWFAQSAKPITSQAIGTAKRLFRIESRPVSNITVPKPIQNNFNFLFYDGAPGENLQHYTLHPISALPHLPQTRLYDSFKQLAIKLSEFLLGLKRDQTDHPIRRVFVAETTSNRRESLIEALEPHEAVWFARAPGMTDEQFKQGTLSHLKSCYRSVHIIDTTQKLTLDRRTDLEIQLDCALTHTRQDFRTVVWIDSEPPVADSELNDFLVKLPGLLLDRPNAEFFKPGYEDLTSYLADVCRTFAEPSAMVVPLQMPGRTIFLQCQRKDYDALGPIITEIRDRNMNVLFPVQDSGDEADKITEKRLRAADAAVVYWGSLKELLMLSKCDRTAEIAEAAGKRRVIGLDPHDVYRRSNHHEKFVPIEFLPTTPKKAVDELLKVLNGGGQ
jgi:hypothetical protein